MARIGILTGPKVTERNMEHLVFRISEILSTQHTIDIVGLLETSKRIEERFSIFRGYKNLNASIPFPSSIMHKTAILRRYVSQKHPDVLMAVSSIGSNGFTVGLVGKMIGLPSVVRVTSDIFRVQKYKRPLSQRARLFLKNNILGRVTMLLARRTLLLHEVQLSQLVSAGYDRKRFFVVPQPVTFPRNAPETENGGVIRGEYSISAGAYVVGWIGRVSQDKDIEQLMNVIHFTLTRDPMICFMIVGDGPEKKRLVNELQRYPQVTFVSQIPRDSLADYYKDCNVILHTSYSEGLSNVIAEALYFERPVIAQDSGPITRALVSNIGRTTSELAHFILTRTAKQDELPKSLVPRMNSELYLLAVNSLLQD